MDPTGAKYFIKLIFDYKIEIGIFEISIRPNFNKFWAFFILSLAIGKCLITNHFYIKIEIGIFEMSNVPNFNQFWALLILGPIWV